MVLSKYHSVFLTSDGDVYALGHGFGGRLGLGHENAALVSVTDEKYSLLLILILLILLILLIVRLFLMIFLNILIDTTTYGNQQ